ncbi:MAG: SANT/Myb domain-containing protein [Puniceicoccales bacterium]|jgi:hypothetical protein|nr:SANT/Myb domain-containing protein [Puniceicoccales bacterium]
MMKIKWSQWIVGCFLLGILSRGYATRWIPEEDGVVIKFVQACTSNPYLTWQNCADAVNQYLEAMGLNYRRTAEACREHWDHCLKQRFPPLHKPHNLKSRRWSEDENARFMELIRRHTNGRRTNWEAVSRDIGDRSSAQCRAHYGILASREWSPFEEAPKGAAGQQNGRFDLMDSDIPVCDDSENSFEDSLLENF